MYTVQGSCYIFLFLFPCLYTCMIILYLNLNAVVLFKYELYTIAFADGVWSVSYRTIPRMTVITEWLDTVKCPIGHNFIHFFFAFIFQYLRVTPSKWEISIPFQLLMWNYLGYSMIILLSMELQRKGKISYGHYRFRMSVR